MKVLSAESNFLGIGVSATQINGATVVRLANTSENSGTVQVLENDAENNYYGAVIGSITIPAGEVVYLQKKSEEWLSGDSIIKYVQVAYSHMMYYASYSSSGGGGSSIVTENLVLNLDAGDNSSYGGSGTTWTDLSGQNNNGTLINGVTYNSGDGGYLIFDGTNDRVTLPAGSDFAYGTGDFTVEIWFNVTGTTPQNWGEVLFAQTVSGTNYFVCNTSRGNPVQKKPTFTYGTGGGTAIGSVQSYTEDNWYHYVVTRNGTTLTMYLNNSVVASGTVSFNFTNTTYVPTIGGYTHTNSNNLDGKISIVRVYKGKGFSSSDVTQNFDAVKSRYGY